jgi:hypothetical protein
MSKTWFHVSQGKRQGPVEVNELLDVIFAKSTGEQTLVWREGLSGWTPASQLPELAQFFPPVAPITRETPSTPTVTRAVGPPASSMPSAMGPSTSTAGPPPPAPDPTTTQSLRSPGRSISPASVSAASAATLPARLFRSRFAVLLLAGVVVIALALVLIPETRVPKQGYRCLTVLYGGTKFKASTMERNRLTSRVTLTLFRSPSDGLGAALHRLSGMEAKYGTLPRAPSRRIQLSGYDAILDSDRCFCYYDEPACVHR